MSETQKPDSPNLTDQKLTEEELASEKLNEEKLKNLAASLSEELGADGKPKVEDTPSESGSVSGPSGDEVSLDEVSLDAVAPPASEKPTPQLEKAAERPPAEAAALPPSPPRTDDDVLNLEDLDRLLNDAD